MNIDKIKSLATQLPECKKRLEALREERDVVEARRGSKADFKKRLIGDLSHRRDNARKRLVDHKLSLLAQRSAYEREDTSLPLAIIGEQSIHQIADAIYLFCGDRMEEELNAIVDAMDWPDEGLPPKKRAAEVEKLDAEITALEQTIKDLQKALA